MDTIEYCEYRQPHMYNPAVHDEYNLARHMHDSRRFSGHGLSGYLLAVERLLKELREQQERENGKILNYIRVVL